MCTDVVYTSTRSVSAEVTCASEVVSSFDLFDSRALLPSERSDLLKGLLIVLTYFCMSQFDASRVYHSIRGQSSIKLYVLFNVLDVPPPTSKTDIDCGSVMLFNWTRYLRCYILAQRCGTRWENRTFPKMDRKYPPRTNLQRYFPRRRGFDIVIHTSMLFFQVVTLNVAVNSYSNALLSLLMSNQFVEIKATVFKKFEKENLFQMACAGNNPHTPQLTLKPQTLSNDSIYRSC